MTQKQASEKQAEERGFQGFLQDVRHQVAHTVAEQQSTRDFILTIGERYSYIRMEDLKHPVRFLKQLSGQPPVCFGAKGFRRELVDDREPARHYTAFVFVGYWLPTLLAIPVLWAWELLGFVRYRGNWSQPDIRCGNVGIRHGRAVRKEGAAILPDLIDRDLRAHNSVSSSR